jgi:hypothetical protein
MKEHLIRRERDNKTLFRFFWWILDRVKLVLHILPLPYFKLFLSCQIRIHDNAVISYENVVYQGVLLAHGSVIRDVES